MTKKQRLNEALKSGISGIFISIVLYILAFYWIKATQLLVDIDGFGLGAIVNILPIIGYGIVVVATLILGDAVMQLVRFSRSKSKSTQQQEVVKKKQEGALVTERSTFEKQRIKGVIFDLDGTLLDTLDDLTSAANLAISRHGYPIKTRYEVREVIGSGMRNLIKGLIDPEATDGEIDLILKHFLESYSVMYQDKTKPYDGITQLLESLNKRGYLLGVVSNKRQEYTRELCKNLFPNIPFVDVIGDVDGQPRKPDPTTTQLIIEEMMLPTSQIAFVGDSKFDIQTAKNARALSIGCTWGYGSLASLEQEKPDFIVNEPERIFDILTDINTKSL